MSSLNVIFCNGQSHYVQINTSGGTPSTGGTIFNDDTIEIPSGGCVTRTIFSSCPWEIVVIPPTANITVTPSSGAANVLTQVEICASSSGQICVQYCEEQTCIDIIPTTGSTGSTNYLPQGASYVINASAQTLSIPYVGCVRSVSSADFATASFAGNNIQVYVTENPNESNRSVTLTVTWCDGTTQTITITQAQIFYKWENISPSVETICDECQCTTVGCQLTSSVTSSWSICANNQMSRTVSSLTRSCCEDDWTIVGTSIETSACTNPTPAPDANGHAYVDFGLPSGTLWATMNVGATSETDYGLYFQWGDTQGYTASQVGTEKQFDWLDYKYANGNYNKLTKYCYNSIYGNDGFRDNLRILELSDDAARVHMGGDWKMPSVEQVQELIDYTVREWTDDYQGTGFKGTTFTRRGKTLFILAAGYYNPSEPSHSVHQNVSGAYWLNSVSDGVPYVSPYLSLIRDTSQGMTVAHFGGSHRCIGCTIRGVLR